MEQCGGDGKIWDRLGLEIRNDLDAMKSGGQRGAGVEYSICLLVQAWSVGVDRSEEDI